jgi:signal transduction histidine kinase/ActR/RegA family two-component response regulator
MAREPTSEDHSVKLELLQLLARQGRRMPYPVGLSAVVIAAMAAPRLPLWVTVGWVALVFAVLALRWVLLGRLPAMQQLPVDKRLQWAVGLSLLNGLVFTLSLAFAPYMSDYQRMVQTLLLLGLCAGAVASTAGNAPVFRAFLVPLTLANSLAWLVGGTHGLGWEDWALSLLILGFGLILAGLARDTYRVFVESVLIRQQQVKSNQQLRLALSQGEQAMLAKTRFLASASHDLRQPMHTLSLFGAALEMRQLDKSAAEIAANMNLALRSLSSQMDALLDISKLDAQVVPVHNQAIALSPWLTRLHQEFLPMAQRKHLRLTLLCQPAAWVESDPVLLERVVRNLLDNAIKYTQAGEVVIEVTEGDEVWIIEVRDTGAGIAEHEQARVFDEFYQIGNPERDRNKGLGLGLSIVSRLVDLLDLHLELKSVQGLGSSFKLSIAATEAGSAVSAQSSSMPELSLPPLRVLVIDDEEPVRLAMQALLSAHGCEVVGASGTREGLLKSMAARPDIALVDFRLRAGEDGISAVRSLRSAVPGLPAVLISGDTAPERLRDALAAGLILLHKPVSQEQLVAAMHAALAAAYPHDGPGI